jgi:hypothetical protein
MFQGKERRLRCVLPLIGSGGDSCRVIGESHACDYMRQTVLITATSTACWWPCSAQCGTYYHMHDFHLLSCGECGRFLSQVYMRQTHGSSMFCTRMCALPLTASWNCQCSCQRIAYTSTSDCCDCHEATGRNLGKETVNLARWCGPLAQVSATQAGQNNTPAPEHDPDAWYSPAIMQMRVTAHDPN